MHLKAMGLVQALLLFTLQVSNRLLWQLVAVDRELHQNLRLENV